MLQKKNSKTGNFAGTIIDFKTQKRLRDRRNGIRSRWNWISFVSLAMFTVGLAAAAGALMGRWIDSQFAVPFSSSLALMILGAAAGCLMLWRWRKS